MPIYNSLIKKPIVFHTFYDLIYVTWYRKRISYIHIRIQHLTYEEKWLFFLSTFFNISFNNVARYVLSLKKNTIFFAQSHSPLIIIVPVVESE